MNLVHLSTKQITYNILLSTIHYNTIQKVEERPCVLLAIRISVTPTELAFGQGLKIPEEYIVETASSNEASPANLIDRLILFIRNLNPSETRNNSQQKVHVPLVLSSCSHICIWIDKVKPSLTLSYEGTSS